MRVLVALLLAGCVAETAPPPDIVYGSFAAETCRRAAQFHADLARVCPPVAPPPIDCDGVVAVNVWVAQAYDLNCFAHVRTMTCGQMMAAELPTSCSPEFYR